MLPSGKTWAEEILDFQFKLSIPSEIIPAGINVMYPLRDNESVKEIMQLFYNRYYNDHNPRKLILGINPGRFGAGVTGIPFTDTRRLEEECQISFPEIKTHEPSSVFIYEVIKAFGGPERFYSEFFITSLVPLGLTQEKKGRAVNFNYYDHSGLKKDLEPFILHWLKEQIGWGLNTDEIVCLGTGNNFRYLKKFNEKHQLFRSITPLEHPRFIVQYKWKHRKEYVDRYIKGLTF